MVVEQEHHTEVIHMQEVKEVRRRLIQYPQLAVAADIMVVVRKVMGYLVDALTESGFVKPPVDASQILKLRRRSRPVTTLNTSPRPR